MPYPGWFETDFRYFLYDSQNEIGSFDQNFNQQELRILADSETAEIGSAIAFEIGDKIYAPIYDISGNVISLIFNKTLSEHYRYFVFGERKIYSSSKHEIPISQINNPWQFSSKRIDEESKLIYYGRRYYDSSLGRWLTCDPKGFVDGLNLYAFVLNDPLIKYDLYGLYANPWMMPPNTQTGNDIVGAAFHKTADFGVQNINFLSDIGFGLSSPFLYGYRSLTGGSFGNDYRNYLQGRDNLRSDVQNFMQRIIPVNQDSKAYRTSSYMTDATLNGMALGAGIGGLYKAGGRALHLVRF